MTCVPYHAFDPHVSTEGIDGRDKPTRLERGTNATESAGQSVDEKEERIHAKFDSRKLLLALRHENAELGNRR